MLPFWLTVVAWLSVVVALLCAAGLLVDVLRHPQPMTIMNWVWPITALYGGPLAVWVYVRLGRAVPRPPSTQARPFWQGVTVGGTHCGAGCTLGDIIAEVALFVTGFTIAGSMLGTEYVADFALAYILGIVFQYFAIAPMRGLSLWPGLWAAIKADTLSLTAFEIGLFGWMALTYFVFFHPPLRPNQVEYWFMMQIGMLIGFVTAYPMNCWLIRAGIKENM
jgi:Domain of unknown function (DUF4396)